ncbi:hypothetical protein GLOTRDRAFT_139004 [Gloeophyllum trabeum ATCC 11539]|uniref:DUF5745 domain-containing protein n=1 Tax=Gloeophyllum trabeum (strain ATCC 11539 / FP-39264 / Madison 617) TaxID=670483 RepID=S7RNQ6_GLOTA|nr:uncharacterized protein GLOTRDRAFT_139004 [Gloeophyllum trabeum ATCC 11539]EPQ54409.1 hypothetical protein GLOTRDRAFT_139004 [Gloeophyllum trabeum ATCC 11539]
MPRGSTNAQSSEVQALNNLLASLDLPFTLESPEELIPSLLLAILESILRTRLPIAANIRESRTLADKVQAMKIFLGVLENDIIGVDVGLSDMDPRKLAVGEHEEVVFVGELLCWLSRKHGLGLPGESLDTIPDVPPMHFRDARVYDRAPSPSVHSTITSSPNTTYSFQTHAILSADTTAIDLTGSPTDTYASTLARGRSERRCRPRCIHEVDDSSFLAELHGLRRPGPSNETRNEPEDFSADDLSASYCDCSHNVSSQQTIPVRTAGWLDEVDPNLELASFESSRRMQGRAGQSCRSREASTSIATDRSKGGSTSYPVITKHNSPNQHRLALLNERAKLLAELATLKSRKK